MSWIKDTKTSIRSEHSCGIITQRINGIQNYRIQYESTEWPAQFSKSFNEHICSPGDIVKVVGRVGLTVLFEPI